MLVLQSTNSTYYVKFLSGFHYEASKENWNKSIIIMNVKLT